MNKVLDALGVFSLAFMAATLLLGLSLGDVRNPDDLTTQRWATVHRLSGVAAGLCVVLVDSIVITYFIGTSRWCKEVVETYGLDRALIQQSNRLKRRTFPISTVSMLAVVAVVALGGAADPAASLQLQPLGGLTWANIHMLGAIVGLALVGLGFVIQRNNMEANHANVGAVMEAVRKVRLDRGLEVEEAAAR